jgi:protocatechuate 3,4-dioxygenase beta subunit
MKPFVILFILSCLGGFWQKEDCKCPPPSPGVKTSWGQENVIIKREEPFKFLHGKITGSSDGKPLAEVLVEVYDKPEGLLLGWKEREARKSKQRKIAACVTGKDGEFCFGKIPAGKYELRCSKPVEWNCTSVYVVVAPGERKSLASQIIVPMQISQ